MSSIVKHFQMRATICILHLVFVKINADAVADLRGGPPPGPNSFIFMQFSAEKIG